MKQVSILFAIAFLLPLFTVRAQQIAIKKETVYVDGNPYIKLVKSGSAWARDFSFQNLNGEELLTAKPVLKDLGGGQDYVYYQIKVKGNQTKSEIEDQENLGRTLAGELFKLQVISAGALNPAGVNALLEKYPPSISARLLEQEKLAEAAAQSFVGNGPNASGPVPDQLVLVPGKTPSEKNTASQPAPSPEATALNNIHLNGNTLFKNNVKIGQFKVIDQTEDDTKTRIYTIFNAQNKKVAVATFPSMDSQHCQILTSPDAKTHQLHLKNDNRAIRALTEWLVQHDYL